jgi:hypothetical protein
LAGSSAAISSDDAQLLVKIVEQRPTSLTAIFVDTMRAVIRLTPLSFGIEIGAQRTSFNHAHLKNLGLIERQEGRWDFTAFGEGFIEAVSDPGLPEGTTG